MTPEPSLFPGQALTVLKCMYNPQSTEQMVFPVSLSPSSPSNLGCYQSINVLDLSKCSRNRALEGAPAALPISEPSLKPDPEISFSSWEALGWLITFINFSAYLNNIFQYSFAAANSGIASIPHCCQQLLLLHSPRNSDLALYINVNLKEKKKKPTQTL